MRGSKLEVGRDMRTGWTRHAASLHYGAVHGWTRTTRTVRTHPPWTVFRPPDWECEMCPIPPANLSTCRSCHSHNKQPCSHSVCPLLRLWPVIAWPWERLLGLEDCKSTASPDGGGRSAQTRGH